MGARLYGFEGEADEPPAFREAGLRVAKAQQTRLLGALEVYFRPVMSLRFH